MNFRFYNILILFPIVVGCAHQSIVFREHASDQIIHCSQMENIENISDYAIYLEKGDKIPLKISLDSDLFDIPATKVDLILKQKLYFRWEMPEGINADNKPPMSKEENQMVLKNIMIYLSSDAKRWAPHTDMKAVGKAYGIKGGSISLGMGITKQDGITIFLNAKTNRK